MPPGLLFSFCGDRWRGGGQILTDVVEVYQITSLPAKVLAELIHDPRSAVAHTVLGMVLVFGSSVIYPSYANAAHHVMTVLDDQQLAGAVLWMGMLPPVIIAAVAVLLRWIDHEEAEALSVGFNRLLKPRESAWPSRPRFR